ncbi:MAG: type II/IV secretion system protein, partial [Puniceicoccaceae bacterium]
MLSLLATASPDTPAATPHFLEEQSRFFLWFLLASLAWLGALAASAHVSRLPPKRKELVNLLSLILGPPGWLIHLVSWKTRQIPQAIEVPVRAPSSGSSAVRYAGAATPSSGPVRLPPLGQSGRWHRWFRWLLPGEDGDAKTRDSRRLSRLLVEAVHQSATDIHFEPHEADYLARLRVNGILRDFESFDRATGERLISMVKVMAALDVADKLKPQDGRFEWTSEQPDLRIDTRVSVSPSLRGEKLALRFLNRPVAKLEMQSLGMSEAMQKMLRRSLRQPEGFIIVAGPTGSGKTTTAYSILNHLAGPTVNTMTIEDPVEYTLPYATQIAINPKLGITFESGLTTLLRQDPDIILIGEMRDQGSFRTGIRASLSGHLVLSTLHARDAIQVFGNLRNLGIEPSSLAAAVKMVIAQRLVRLLCPYCKTQDTELEEDALNFLGERAHEIA